MDLVVSRVILWARFKIWLDHIMHSAIAQICEVILLTY